MCRPHGSGVSHGGRQTHHVCCQWPLSILFDLCWLGCVQMVPRVGCMLVVTGMTCLDDRVGRGGEGRGRRSESCHCTAHSISTKAYAHCIIASVKHEEPVRSCCDRTVVVTSAASFVPIWETTVRKIFPSVDDRCAFSDSSNDYRCEYGTNVGVRYRSFAISSFGSAKDMIRQTELHTPEHSLLCIATGSERSLSSSECNKYANFFYTIILPLVLQRAA